LKEEEVTHMKAEEQVKQCTNEGAQRQGTKQFKEE
jgi:hypothetical protein